MIRAAAIRAGMGDLAPANPKDAQVHRAFHHFLWVGGGPLLLVYGGTWLLVQVGIVQNGSITEIWLEWLEWLGLGFWCASVVFLWRWPVGGTEPEWRSGNARWH